MRLSVFGCVLAGLIASTPVVAAEAEVDPERRALFISIIEANDCKMHNFDPAQGILDAFEEHGFTKAEVRPIGRGMFKDGTAVREGDYLILKTEKCA